MDKKSIPATWYDSLIKSDSVKNDKGAFWESEIIQIDEKNREFTNQLELLRNSDKKRESLYESIFHSDQGEVDKKSPTNLEKLIEVLRDPNTEVHYRDRPDKISGRHSIFKILADAFDPVLRLVIVEGRLDWLELDFSGVPIPLANYLVSWDCVKLSADSLKFAGTAINLAYESPNNFPIKKAEQTLANRAKLLPPTEN